MPAFRTIDALEAKGKRVLVRADLNVPMKDGAVSDTARIDQAAMTIRDLSARGAKVIVLRLKRTHNPDVVCLELLHGFLADMKRRGVIVLLCGVRQELSELFARLGFGPCLPAEQVFEEAPPVSGAGTDALLTSTLRAVKRAYELLGDDVCATCPRRQELLEEKEWYYVI